jgi:uncharacterized membrane protein
MSPRVMENLTFQPVLPFWLLALVFLLGLGLLMIGPSFPALSGSKRFLLQAIRGVVLLLALFAAVRPGCVEQIEKQQAGVLLLLIDQSRSMEFPHVKDDSTRWGVLTETVKANSGRFQILKNNQIDVRASGFDSQLASYEFEQGQFKLPVKPLGSETDIGSSLNQAVLGIREERVLGVFLLSDGNQNATDPEIEPLQAMQLLKDLEIPLFAVPFGLPGDAGQLADVAITNFGEQHVVNVKNDMNAKATLIARGYANQPIRVDLILIDQAGSESVVATDFVTPNESYMEKNIELTFRPTQPGEFRLKMRANPMPGEQAIRNNELEGFLTVNDKGMRVLFVVGNLNWEQSRLRESLAVNDFIQIDFIEISPNSRRNWPLTQYEELFSDPTYDVFVLMDVSSRALHDPNTYTKTFDALAEQIYKGKGILMLGGYHSFGAGLYYQTPLADILPVKMNRNERQDFDTDVRRELHLDQDIGLQARDHFITRLGGDINTWRNLPPLKGANRIEAKDNALVILESNDEVRRPLMAITDVGGRAAVFAGDTTWRWKMRGLSEYDQFWRQVILWLAKWDSRTDESISIILSQRRFSPTTNIRFNVTVNTLSSDDSLPKFEGRLITPSNESIPLNVNRIGSDFAGVLSPEWVSQPGLYRLEVEGFRDSALIGTSRREFIVMDRDKEKADPVANPEFLARLASQTNEYGGQLVLPEQLNQVLDKIIADPPVAKIEIPIKTRFGDQTGDSLIFLLAFVGLMTAEWILRKKWGLV